MPSLLIEFSHAFSVVRIQRMCPFALLEFALALHLWNTRVIGRGLEVIVAVQVRSTLCRNAVCNGIGVHWFGSSLRRGLRFRFSECVWASRIQKRIQEIQEDRWAKKFKRHMENAMTDVRENRDFKSKSMMSCASQSVISMAQIPVQARSGENPMGVTETRSNTKAETVSAPSNEAFGGIAHLGI